MAPNPDANPDDVYTLVCGMDRDQLTNTLLHLESKVHVDFTPDYLAGLSTDKLRHLLWTAILCLTPAKDHPAAV